MKREHAELIHQALETATDGNWPATRDGLVEAGYSPQEIIEAWKALESEAGRTGTAPALEDF